MSAWLQGSSSYLVFGDELDEFWTNPSPLLNLVCYIVQVGSAGCQGANLLNGRVFYGEVLIQILSVTPDISLQKVYALHLQEYMNGFGCSIHVRSGNLDHLQTRGLLNQVEEVHIGCS